LAVYVKRLEIWEFPAISKEPEMMLAKFGNRLVKVLDEGAYYSLVVYNEFGMEITEYIENSELEFIETEDEE
jgi:hypothetical protein